MDLQSAWSGLATDLLLSAPRFDMTSIDLSNLLPIYLSTLPSGEHPTDFWFKRWSCADISHYRQLANSFVTQETRTLTRLTQLLQSQAVTQYLDIEISQPENINPSTRPDKSETSPRLAKRPRLSTSPAEFPIATRTRSCLKREPAPSPEPARPLLESADVYDMVELYRLQVKLVDRVRNLSTMLEEVAAASTDLLDRQIVEGCAEIEEVAIEIWGLSKASKTCDLEITAAIRADPSPSIEAHWLLCEKGLAHAWMDSFIMKASLSSVVPQSPESLGQDRMIR